MQPQVARINDPLPSSFNQERHRAITGVIDWERSHAKLAYSPRLTREQYLLATTAQSTLAGEKRAGHKHLAGSPTEIDRNFRTRVFDQTKMIPMGVAQKNA